MTRQERIDRITNRLQERIQKHQNAARDALQRERAIGACIPMGQPILVGHYSERRHRRDIERMHKLMGRFCEESKTVEHLEGRLGNVGRSISRKDDDAIELYTTKLAQLEARHKRMKDANKILKGKGTDQEKIDALDALGYDDIGIHEIMNPDFAGRIGYTFHLVNSTAEIRRVKAKIAQISKERSRPEAEISLECATIRENEQHQGIEIKFPGKPDQKIIDSLKQNGFRWAFRSGVWYKNRRDDFTLELAQKIVKGDV